MHRRNSANLLALRYLMQCHKSHQRQQVRFEAMPAASGQENSTSQTYHTISKTSIKTTLSHQQLGHPQLPGSSVILQGKKLNPWNHGCISFKSMTHSLETLWPRSFFSGSCLHRVRWCSLKTYLIQMFSVG